MQARRMFTSAVRLWSQAVTLFPSPCSKDQLKRRGVKCVFTPVCGVSVKFVCKGGQFRTTCKKSSEKWKLCFAVVAHKRKLRPLLQEKQHKHIYNKKPRASTPQSHSNGSFFNPANVPFYPHLYQFRQSLAQVQKTPDCATPEVSIPAITCNRKH